MKRFFYVATAVAIIIAAYFFLKPTSISVEVAVIAPQKFVETLTSEGKIRSKTRRTVYAFATGSIDSTTFKVGDQVKKGQKILTLDWDKAFEVKSPMEGVITKIHRDSAGPINRGDPIFEVSNLNEVEIAVDLLTPDAFKLKVGGSAKIKNWGGDGDLEAEVSQISKAGVVKLSALGVEEERTEAKLNLKSIQKNLKDKIGDNYHVDVVFILSEKENALTVPLGALFKNGENWAVYSIEQGRAKLRDIRIGEKNDREALVVEGLRESDAIILFPSDKIKDGVRVNSF
jgi:HlyD family secretion protein